MTFNTKYIHTTSYCYNKEIRDIKPYTLKAEFEYLSITSLVVNCVHS